MVNEQDLIRKAKSGKEKSVINGIGKIDSVTKSVIGKTKSKGTAKTAEDILRNAR